MNCGDTLDIVRAWTVKREHKPVSKTKMSTKRLMIIGGEKSNNQPYSSIEYYCQRFGKWKHWQPLIDARKNYAVAVMRNEMYIIGGQLNDTYLDTVIYKRLIDSFWNGFFFFIKILRICALIFCYLGLSHRFGYDENHRTAADENETQKCGRLCR